MRFNTVQQVHEQNRVYSVVFQVRVRIDFRPIHLQHIGANGYERLLHLLPPLAPAGGERTLGCIFKRSTCRGKRIERFHQFLLFTDRHHYLGRSRIYRRFESGKAGAGIHRPHTCSFFNYFRGGFIHPHAAVLPNRPIDGKAYTASLSRKPHLFALAGECIHEAVGVGVVALSWIAHHRGHG